jgi:hypothetical protein
MTSYKITASATDSNGVEIDASTAEALGHAYGRTYTSRAEALDVADDLANDLPEGWETTVYTVIRA